MRRAIRLILLTALLLVLLPYVLTPLYAVGHPVSTLMIGRWLTGQPVTREWLDIDAMDESDLQEAIVTLNTTPRKCLGFKTPLQVLLKELGKDVQIRFS